MSEVEVHRGINAAHETFALELEKRGVTVVTPKSVVAHKSQDTIREQNRVETAGRPVAAAPAPQPFSDPRSDMPRQAGHHMAESTAIRAQIDPATEAAIHAVFAKLTPDQRDQHRAAYQRDLVRARNGEMIRNGKWVPQTSVSLPAVTPADVYNNGQGTGPATAADIAACATHEQKLAAATKLEKSLDANGCCNTSHIPLMLTSGYVLAPGRRIDARVAYAMLADARKAGFTQAMVDTYVMANCPGIK
jgi:hypothetical protein